MRAPLNVRKTARLAATSVAAGTALVLIFLGAPADAATLVVNGSRGI